MADTKGLAAGGDPALREVHFLRRLAQAAASTLTPDALLKLIIDETTEAMATDVCSLYLWDADAKNLVLWATNGLSQDAVGKVRMVLGEGVTGWVARERKPLSVPDVRAESRFKWLPGVDEDRFMSMLSVPIESGPRMVGVLNVQAVTSRDFQDSDIAFLSAIAGQVAGILERSELQRRLEAQLQEIQGSHDIHTAFTQLALEGAGLSAILEAIGSLAASPIELYDPDGYRLARLGRKPRPGLPARLVLPEALTGKPSRQRGSRKATGGPTLVPVRAGEQLLAVLAVLDPQGPVDASGRRQALEHGATVLALEMAKERATAEVERRLRGELVDALFDRRLNAAEARRLAQQAERLGQRISPASWVIVLAPDDEPSGQALARVAVQDRVHTALSDACSRRRPGTVVVTRASLFVLLIPSGHGAQELTVAALEGFARELLAGLRPVIRPASMSAGVGNRTGEVSELARAYDQAQQALRLSRKSGARSQVVSYHGLGAFRLLLEVERPEALRQYVNETLGPLLNYAHDRRTPLMATLEAMVNARWNRRAAARDLGVHVNSLLYRLQRIEELSGMKLDDAEARVNIAIALRAWGLLGDRASA